MELIVDVGHLRSVTAYAGIPLTLWGGEVLPAAGVDGSVAAPRASWSIREFREGAFSEAEEAHYYDIPQVGSSALPPRTDGEPLTVVVRDSAGVAVVDAVVELRKNGVLIADSTVGDGVYHFDGVPAGDCQIYVGRLPGFVRIEEIVFNDESKRFEIDLTARASCKGRVVDDGGNPVSGVRVLSWNTSGRWDNWVVTDADGLFEVAADDEDTCRVWACVPGQGLRWPACGMLISSNTRELGDLKIAPQRCRGKLIVRCPRLVGLDWSAATVRVWQESSGIGLRAVALEDPGVFVSQDMPAGRYLVEMYAPGVGLQKLGSITSTGDTAVELDAVLVGVGTVNLTLRDKPTPMGGRWLARRYGNGWRQVELRANSDTLMLAEGEYSIGDGESRDLASGVAFYVGTGSRCVVELDDDRRQ